MYACMCYVFCFRFIPISLLLTFFLNDRLSFFVAWNKKKVFKTKKKTEYKRIFFFSHNLNNKMNGLDRY